MLTLLLGASVVVLLWFFQGQRSGIRQNGRKLPRPPGTLPLAGNGIWFLQPRHRLLDWFSERERLIGFQTYEISVPSVPPAIVINDPRNVEHVLKDNETFVKGAQFRLRSWDLFGNGIINADGDLWRVQRKAGLRFFSNANLRRFIDEVLPPMLEETYDVLDEAAKTKTMIDLDSVFLDLTTRFMGKVAYNMDMTSSHSFSKAFDFASGAIGNRFQNPFWKMTELVCGSSLRNAFREVKSFGDLIVKNAVHKRDLLLSSAEHFSTEKVDVMRNSLIDSLLDHVPDKAVVADAAMNYLSAGRDTTAQSMTWAAYMLLRHQRARVAILEELKPLFPSSKEKVTVDWDLMASGSLPYTLAAFYETIRLFPPVPIELKECTQESIFPDGTVLPKDTVVMWAPWAMGRSKAIWGEDADNFKPERWLNRTEAGAVGLISKTAFEFPVFNAGPRACLGKKMAELLAVKIISSLTWRYDFQESDPSQQRISQNSLTLPMEGGLQCMVSIGKR